MYCDELTLPWFNSCRLRTRTSCPVLLESRAPLLQMCIDVHDMNGRKPQRRNAFAGKFKFSAEHDIALVLHAMKKAAPRIFMSGTVGRVKYKNRLRYIRDNSEAVQYLMASQNDIRSLAVAALELHASKFSLSQGVGV